VHAFEIVLFRAKKYTSIAKISNRRFRSAGHFDDKCAGCLATGDRLLEICDPSYNVF